MSLNSMRMIELYKPHLVTVAKEMRARGDSFDAISHYLTVESGQPIGRESVRRWFVAAIVAPSESEE